MASVPVSLHKADFVAWSRSALQRINLTLHRHLFRCTQLDVVAQGGVGRCNETKAFSRGGLVNGLAPKLLRSYGYQMSKVTPVFRQCFRTSGFPTHLLSMQRGVE